MRRPAARLETGKFETPGDWPGVFIRGDDALAFAGIIRRLGVRIVDLNGKDLEKLLRSCHVKEATRC